MGDLWGHTDIKGVLSGTKGSAPHGGSGTRRNHLRSPLPPNNVVFSRGGRGGTAHQHTFGSYRFEHHVPVNAPLYILHFFSPLLLFGWSADDLRPPLPPFVTPLQRLFDGSEPPLPPPPFSPSFPANNLRFSSFSPPSSASLSPELALFYELSPFYFTNAHKSDCTNTTPPPQPPPHPPVLTHCNIYHPTMKHEHLRIPPSPLPRLHWLNGENQLISDSGRKISGGNEDLGRSCCLFFFVRGGLKGGGGGGEGWGRSTCSAK